MIPPMAGPCDSPNVVSVNMLPNVLRMRYLSVCEFFLLLLDSEVGSACTHIVDEVTWVDFQLKPALASAHIDIVIVCAATVEIGGEGLFHAHWRAAAPYVSCSGQQLFHVDEVAFLVARHLGCFFQVNFFEPGYYTHKVPRLVALQHQRLEHAASLLAQDVDDVLCTQLVFIYRVGYQLIFHMSTVQQTCSIGFRYLFHYLILSEMQNYSIFVYICNLKSKNR